MADALRESGIDPIATREPGGTAAGEAIRAVVLDEGLRLDAVAELLLMLAARSVFVGEIVRPALERGEIVLTDRYDLSSFAYQGGGRGLSIDAIKGLNEVATGGLRPDLCIVLDVDVGDGRSRGRSHATDRIENEGQEFHERVARAYRELAGADPDIALVDGRPEIGEVFAAVWENLSARFPETFQPRRC